MMKRCRTLNGLCTAISRGERAVLKVYGGGSIERTMPGAWAVNEDTVTLNLGQGRYVMCSKREYAYIKGHLEVVSGDDT